MIPGVTYIASFVGSPEALFESLSHEVEWDQRMIARKTASFGIAYNYSQIQYPFQPFLPSLQQLNHKINEALGFTPNNCLINFYPDGRSKMGFHSDQTDILQAGTGIAIVSLGEVRTLKFRNMSLTFRNIRDIEK